MFKQNPRVSIFFFFFFFRLKVDGPFSFEDVKFLPNQSREAKFVITSFL